MGTLSSYLLQMACWLAGFWIVYAAFLRNETFFRLNRWFLLTGLMASVIMPLFPINYKVEAPVSNIVAVNAAVSYGQAVVVNTSQQLNYWLLAYVLGLLFFMFRFVWQTYRLLNMRKQDETEQSGSGKVYRLDTDTAPFSFFNNIYVSKKMCGETELKAVIAHEKVHIDERHWADLLLLEVVRAMQWFNPLLIFYRKAILQNHEYLADTGTLQKGVSARTYKAILANQMLGMPVVQIANGFTLFNPSKRISMMNKNKTSPKKRFRLLWALPVAALIMAAFAEPVYVQANNAVAANENTQQNTIAVKGKVNDENGNALQGASVVIAGSHVGTLTDANGSFELNGVLPDSDIAISFVGYKTVLLKARKNIDVQLEREIVQIRVVDEAMAPPPPPPPPLIDGIFSIGIGDNENTPLIYLDGKEHKGSVNDIDANSIQKIEVLKDASALIAYGEKGKNGVILITSKSNAPANEEEMFVIVEEMPSFKGGDAALHNYLRMAVDGLGEEGSATVHFTVMPNGSLTNINVTNATSEGIKHKAAEIAKKMPAWNPGMQRGKAVAVDYALTLEFQ